MTINFISIHKYANNQNTTAQNVYRWIREGRFPKNSYKKENITVNRLRISEDAKIPNQ